MASPETPGQRGLDFTGQPYLHRGMGRGFCFSRQVLPAFLCLAIPCLFAPAQSETKGGKPMIKVTSPAFQEGEKIPVQYTADGKNINPPLQIEGVPAEAKSLVLINDDPDAPMGTWTHWVLWNIDPQTTEIREDGVPKNAVAGLNDFGKTKYGGPAPPSGTHRYFFKVYALDVILDLPQGSKRAFLEKAMKGHVVAEGQLMGKYSRNR